jgi:hypothetical protein
MGDVNGLMNKALGIPDHGARLAPGWPGRVTILIPSPMPARVLAFPLPGDYALSHNSIDAMRKADRYCAHRIVRIEDGAGAMGGHLDSTP